jgi:hypothetical protein
MTAVRLAVPFRDARAADLMLSFDTRPADALEQCEVRVDGWDLRLRILGASHQVQISHGGLQFGETVACDPGGRSSGRALPSVARRRHGELTQTFTSRVRPLSAAALTSLATRLTAVLRDDPVGLVAVFPGSPAALTALRVHTGGGCVGWRTWHLYPGTGELVSTDGAVLGCTC